MYCSNLCSNSAFASLVGTPIGITGSVAGLKICVITSVIQKYKSMINYKKKKKKHDKIDLLAKCKSNSLESLISKALIDSNISHDEFFLTNNEFYNVTEKNQKF